MVRSSQHSLGLCELVLLVASENLACHSLPNQALSHSPLRRRGRRREMKIQSVLPLLFSYASASNPFSSNVVLLTQKNWAELDKSPFLWLVNVCRQS
jgi:hypothetical protein